MGGIGEKRVLLRLRVPGPIGRPGPVEALLRQDRAAVLSSLTAISIVAWTYILSLAWGMESSDAAMGMGLSQMRPWETADFVLTFVMWAVMMVAVMVPSAAPMVLMFAAVNRKRREQRGPFVPTGVFLVSYLVVWSGFSALATVFQWQLHAATLLSPTIAVTSPVLGGVLLMAAGIFQWTPLKNVCLAHCRSPLSHIMTDWREGTGGAFVMGFRHGSYCVGCCWLLMALLFVAGVMNLLWVAAIGAFILVEKVLQGNRWLSQTAGLLFIGWGTWMALSPMLRP